MNNRHSYIIDKAFRTIVIGDIHGCYDEFLELLDKVDFKENDILVTVGDIMDRGPKSWELAKFFKETNNAFSVLGNHERRVSGVIKGTSKPAWSQSHTIAKIQEEDKLYWSEWLDTLPAVIETDHVIVTHARLDPSRSLNEQDSYFTSAVGGDNVKIELNEKGIPLWYEDFISKYIINKPICIGHISYDRIELVSNKLYALDTKAVHGGKLTAAVFPQGEIISVDAKKNYYEESYKEWNELLLAKINANNIKLNKIEKILLKSETNDIENKVKIDFMKNLSKNGMIDRLTIIRGHCESVYGVPPSNGIERRDYFLGLNDKISDSNQKKLVKKILTNDKYDLKMFFTLFPTLSLSEVDNLIVQIEKSLLIALCK